MPLCPLLTAISLTYFPSYLPHEQYPVDATKQFVVETRGWAPPPTTRPDLPFAVDRAGVGQGVPVYTDYKAGGTKVVTITRKVRGDVLLLAEELQKIVGDETEVHPLTNILIHAHSH